MKLIKGVFVFFAILIVILIITIFAIDFYVKAEVKDQIYSMKEIDKIPANRVGVVLGTAKYWRKGHLNLYYWYRIKAAAELYKKRKIGCIIVSGDNSFRNYNEPQMMKKDLIKKESST